MQQIYAGQQGCSDWLYKLLTQTTMLDCNMRHQGQPALPLLEAQQLQWSCLPVGIIERISGGPLQPEPAGTELHLLAIAGLSSSP